MECQRCSETANTLITSNERGGLKLCPSCWNAENGRPTDQAIDVRADGLSIVGPPTRKRATAKTK